MVLPSSGDPISFSGIRTEFGTSGTNSSTAPVRLGQYRTNDASFTNKDIGELSGLPLDEGIPTSGSINVDVFYGKKLNAVVDLHSSGSSNYNHNAKTDRFDNGNYTIVGGYKANNELEESNDAGIGWQGGKKMIIHINNTFSSTGAVNQDDVALTVGDGWQANTTIVVDTGSSALVVGKGGGGGKGGDGQGDESGHNGGHGTSAIAVETGTVCDFNLGNVYGGGGGGGGGVGSEVGTGPGNERAGGGGGGGGAGIPAGSHGDEGDEGGASAGFDGESTVGGAGGGGGDSDEAEGRDGGTGGNPGAVGLDGGWNGGGKGVDSSDGSGGAAGSQIIYF